MNPLSFGERLKSSLKKEYIREDLLAGLLVLGPVVLTLYIVFTIISFFGNFFAKLLILLPFISHIPPILKTLIGVIVGVILIYVTGLSVRLFFGFELQRFLDRIMSKIPVVRSIYNAIRDLFQFLHPSQDLKQGAGRFVVFKISEDGPYLAGFVTSPKPLENNGKRYYTIFMPTTPNPTTGFFFMVEEKNLSFVDLDYEDALKFVITAGIFMPEGGENIKNGLAKLYKKVSKESTGKDS
ncbi:MAG: DUF502 domain-containing protein [Candidatus Hydrothermia bacterium]